MRVLTRERTIGAPIKATKPLTANPGTRIEANQKQKLLRTRIKPPRVRIVIGRESSPRIGLTSALTQPITAPATMATIIATILYQLQGEQA